MTVTGRSGRGGWYYGWNIVAVCVVSQVAAMGLTYNAFSLFLRNWAADLHTEISQLQFAMLGLTLVGAITSPVIGSLADKVPPRRLFVAGLIGMALFYFAVGSATSTAQLVVLYALSPIAMGLCTAITSNAVISRWFVRRRGVALGLSAFGNGLAGVILPPIIAVALPAVGWRMIWHFGGILLAVVIAPLMFLVMRSRPTDREGLHYIAEEASAAADGDHDPAAQLGWRDILKSRNFWLLIAIFVALLSTQGGVGQNLGPYVASRGLSEQSAGILLSLLSACGIVSMLVQGFLSDRFGNRLPFAGLAAVVATGAITLAFAEDLPLITLGCVLVGFGGGLFTLLAAGLAQEFGAANMGLAFGMCMIVVPITSLAAFGIARTQEVTGSYAPALFAMAVLLAVAGVLILFLREKRGRPMPTALNSVPST